MYFLKNKYISFTFKISFLIVKLIFLIEKIVMFYHSGCRI